MDCICHFHRKRAFRETVALAELNALFNMDEKEKYIKNYRNGKRSVRGKKLY
jgi:hypothetical protein